MRRNRRWFWILFILVAILAMGIIGYIQANESWQEGYCQRVTDGVVELLQTNPYDRYSVVVIVIDGLRWEEGIGAEDTYLPHIWNDLRPKGTLLTNFRIASPTATTSSHSAMLTGRISTVPNDGHIRPVFPTFLEYYRDARTNYIEQALEDITRVPPGIFRPDAKSLADIGQLVADARDFPPEKTTLYLGKDLIYSLDQSSCGRYPDDDVFLIDGMRDVEVTEYFRAKIPDVHPNIVFVNLGDVDECGHEAEWHYYVDSIRWADTHVWEMWQALQAENRYRDRTYFIVTTDHGRHIPSRGGFPHHGCFCEGCRHSFMLIVGPGIRRGYVSDEPHSELDIAPTVGRMLGFETPGCTGNAITEIFENPDDLPQPGGTATTALVAEDKAKIDDRDTVSILLDSAPTDSAPNPGLSELERAMWLLALSARLRTHPEDVREVRNRLDALIPENTVVEKIDDLLPAYPLILLGREIAAASGSNSHADPENVGWNLLDGAIASGLIDLSTENPPDDLTRPEIAFVAPLMATAGAGRNDPDATRFAYRLMLDALERIEDPGKMYTPRLEDFIGDYRYREGPNEVFTGEISIRDRMWLVWGLERVLAEAEAEHVPDLHPFLLRQYRLLVAFTHEWQDANAMVGGTGDPGEEIDLVAQGICLAALAEFEPWRKWELDELGYDRTIYATPLFSWPVGHFFYILGQANALAGAWAADERLRLYVNDDGSIRHDLLDSGMPISPGSPDHPLIAASLAYGMSRFELADYQLYDLELYPIVHQQE